jgi:large subunit ribosomal protein L19
MNGVVDQIEAAYLKKDIPHIQIGDTVRIHTKIKEGEKERIQIFEGIVIRWKKGGLRSSITVRKISHGVGVERIFPLHTPTIDKIEVKSHGQVRRARLYYLRDLSGKAARIKERGSVQGAVASTTKKDKE